MKKHITWPTLVEHWVTLAYCELMTLKSILIPYTTRISMDVINLIKYQYKIALFNNTLRNTQHGEL